MRRFDTKVVLITGGASGIGKATALRLAEEGASLALSDVRGALTEASHHRAENGTLAPDPERGILLYSGDPDRPKLLGLRTLDGVTSWTPALEPPRNDAAFVRMIRSWESERLDLAAAENALEP